MILRPFPLAALYRVHSPKWAHLPTSGAGAASQGGRLNRKGVDALYLSLETETALAEYQQTSPLLPPGTIASYQVELSQIVDFSGGYNSNWDPLWEEFSCDWRRMVFNDKIEPPTWVLSDMVQAAGAKGILFPSMAQPGGSNLVVFNGMLQPGDQLAVHDPKGELPKDQSSWR